MQNQTPNKRVLWGLQGTRKHSNSFPVTLLWTTLLSDQPMTSCSTVPSSSTGERLPGDHLVSSPGCSWTLVCVAGEELDDTSWNRQVLGKTPPTLPPHHCCLPSEGTQTTRSSPLLPSVQKDIRLRSSAHILLFKNWQLFWKWMVVMIAQHHECT